MCLGLIKQRKSEVYKYQWRCLSGYTNVGGDLCLEDLRLSVISLMPMNFVGHL